MHVQASIQSISKKAHGMYPEYCIKDKMQAHQTSLVSALPPSFTSSSAADDSRIYFSQMSLSYKGRHHKLVLLKAIDMTEKKVQRGSSCLSYWQFKYCKFLCHVHSHTSPERAKEQDESAHCIFSRSKPNISFGTVFINVKFHKGKSYTTKLSVLVCSKIWLQH